MQLRAFRDSAPLLLKIMATADSPLSTPPAGEEWDSLSIDEVSAAGLQNIDVDVDADATVQAESNSSSSASAENVKETVALSQLLPLTLVFRASRAPIPSISRLMPAFKAWQAPPPPLPLVLPMG